MTAMITPFDESGVNFGAFERMIEYQIAGGTDALLILGTTGEPATMTEEEKESVMRFSVKAIAGRAKIVFGSGSNSTAHCTQSGLYEHYKAIAESVRIPLICYNVPARTGVNILPATMERIASIPNIAGIKEACGNMEQICETARRIRGKCDLYSGDDNLNLPILAIGGTGLISVASNILPRETKQMYECVAAGDLADANALQDRMLPVIDQLFTEVNPIPAKEAANLIGLCGGVPRLPLTRLSPEHAKTLKEALAAFDPSLLQ